jgi:putative transcriptional regulator
VANLFLRALRNLREYPLCQPTHHHKFCVYKKIICVYRKKYYFSKRFETAVQSIIMGEIIINMDRLMVDRKISLNELSLKVGLNLTNLSLLKNGRVRAIRFSTLMAICDALDCQPGDILEYRKHPKQNT